MPERVYVGGNDAVAIEVEPEGDITRRQVTVIRGGMVEVGEKQAKEMDVSAAWAKPRTTKKEA